MSIAHDRSFKIRAKRGPWGKGGSLAELTHLLTVTLGGMATAELLTSESIGFSCCASPWQRYSSSRWQACWSLGQASKYQY